MSVRLRCTECHTIWTEACLGEWRPCPFVDCKGQLRAYVPPVAKRPKPEPSTYPLLEAVYEK